MRPLLGLLAVGCWLSAAIAAQPGFDPKDVVRQVRSTHSTPGPLEPLSPVLDDGEFLIDTSVTFVQTPGSQFEPAVAFDGTNYLVVWEDGRSGSGDIYGARVTPAGVVLDTAGIAISTAASPQGYPAVAFDGTNFLVVWTDRRSGGDTSDIYGARVTQAGVVLDTAGIPISQAASYYGYPAVAFDGTNFLVVWMDVRSGAGYDIYGARVTQGGSVLDPNGIAISTAANNPWSPAVAFDGTNYLVVWNDGDIYGARVTPAGVVLDTAGIAISTASGSVPAVAFDGTNYLVVWHDGDVYGARVTPAGVVLDPAGIAISTATYGEWFATVAFDGTDYLVVWRDGRGGGDTSDIYGARVTPAGAVLDSAGIAISTAANDQSSPAVVFGDSSFLAVWEDGRGGSRYDIYGARVTQAGAVPDTAGIIISQAASSQGHPAVASDGANFLVVWEDSRNGSGDIYGARVTPAGAVLDSAGIAISTAANDKWSPAVAFDGANFLAVWADSRSGSGDIYGARVTPAGVVLDTAGIAISTATDGQEDPAVTFDGTNYLAVWEDWRSGLGDIYGARVTPAGVVLDTVGVPVSTAAESQTNPAVAFDGASFLVVWDDSRSGSGIDIYGARVTPAGVVLDPLGIPVSTADGWQEYPVVAFDGTNFLVVWTGGGARVTPAGVVLDPSGIAISAVWLPAVAFDGTNFLAVWTDSRSGSEDIYGARVTPAGVVFDSGPVVRQGLNQSYATLARGTGSQMFLAYQGWAGTIGDKTYNTDRIWGKVNPSPGIEESFKPEATNSEPTQTIVRDVLLLLEATSRKHQAPILLLDISGRKVMNLRPGANDISHLSPGVYFVREASDVKREASGVTKVIVAR